MVDFLAERPVEGVAWIIGPCPVLSSCDALLSSATVGRVGGMVSVCFLELVLRLMNGPHGRGDGARKGV